MLLVCSVVSCTVERVAKYEELRPGLAPKQALPINGQKIRLGSQKIKTSTTLSLSVDLCWHEGAPWDVWSWFQRNRSGYGGGWRWMGQTYQRQHAATIRPLK